MDIAEKLAVRMNSAHVLNYIELDDDNSIFEIDLPSKWENKTLLEINPRGKYGMNILTVKRGSQVISKLDGNFIFESGDQIFAFTNKNDKKKK